MEYEEMRVVPTVEVVYGVGRRQHMAFAPSFRET